MIIGIGTDLVDIDRIEKVLEQHGARFEQRCFTKAEIERAHARKKTGLMVHSYAKRFAAKEACVKALGTGFRDNIYMRDVETVMNELGRPELVLKGGALEMLHSLVPADMTPSMHLSLSDEGKYAQAFVVIEARAG